MQAREGGIGTFGLVPASLDKQSGLAAARRAFGEAVRSLPATTSADLAQQKLMLHIRPRLRGEPARVYALLEPLLRELLFRGSSDVEGDADAMLAELASAPFRECATQNICLYELARVLTTAAALGPEQLDKRLLWPYAKNNVVSRIRLAQLEMKVRALLEDRSGCDRAIAKLVADHGEAWGHPKKKARPTRAKKRPRDPERGGIYRELVRDELFAGRAPMKTVWRAAKLLLIERPSADVFAVELKRIRAGVKKDRTRISDPGRLAAIPKDFHLTLFARRLRVLRSPFIAAVLDGNNEVAATFMRTRTERRRRTRLAANSLPTSS